MGWTSSRKKNEIINKENILTWESILKIEVTDLHKSFGKNEVLKGITTKFEKGDVVCIIGPSGSGKSTFLRALNGLETATSGDIIIDGFNLTDKNTNLNLVRQNVGMVFQHFNPFSKHDCFTKYYLCPN